MHDFAYKDNEFYCENVRIRTIAEKVGTPFYLYSYKTLTDHYLKLERAFESVKPLICFAMKSNSSLAVLKALIQKGAGVDIVSEGELYLARKAGCPPHRIVYAGVGKTDREIEAAIRAKILLFNVESEPELTTIQKIAKKLGKIINVSLRVNPGVDPHTHDYIATGKTDSKFGIDLETARRIFVQAARYPNLSIDGIHSHIGSQITEGEPFVKALRKLLIFIANLEETGCKIEYLNLGGGLGIIYSNEKPQTADEFAKKILPLFPKKKYKLIFEPGRFIVGNAGVFVTKVLYIKHAKTKNFAIIDGGMNDLIRPALYEAYHEVCPLEKKLKAKQVTYDVVGPVCESGDFLATNRKIQELKSDDLLAFMGAGAYGFTMSSQYNARPRVAEVMVKGSRFEVIRKRETFPDLARGSRVPSFLK